MEEAVAAWVVHHIKTERAQAADTVEIVAEAVKVAVAIKATVVHRQAEAAITKVAEAADPVKNRHHVAGVKAVRRVHVQEMTLTSVRRQESGKNGKKADLTGYCSNHILIDSFN